MTEQGRRRGGGQGGDHLRAASMSNLQGARPLSSLQAQTSHWGPVRQPPSSGLGCGPPIPKDGASGLRCGDKGAKNPWARWKVSSSPESNKQSPCGSPVAALQVRTRE